MFKTKRINQTQHDWKEIMWRLYGWLQQMDVTQLSIEFQRQLGDKYLW